MSIATDDALAYYAGYGAITDPGRFAGLFTDLPSDISRLCSVIQYQGSAQSFRGCSYMFFGLNGMVRSYRKKELLRLAFVMLS